MILGVPSLVWKHEKRNLRQHSNELPKSKISDSVITIRNEEN